MTIYQTGLPSSVANVSQLVVLPAPSGGDDTAILNAKIAAAGAGAKIIGAPGTYLLNSGSLTLYPNLDYDLTLSAFAQSGSPGVPMLVNKAQTPVGTATDVTTTSGSNQLTSPQLVAAGAAVGQTIRVAVAGQGPSLHIADWTGTILSVAGNNITLGNVYGSAVNAGQTLTNASASLYTRDANIRLRGGRFTRTDTSGAAHNLHITRFRHLDNFEWSSPSLYSTGPLILYGIEIGDCSNVTIEKVRGVVGRDGVHIDGSCFDITVRDVKMTTGDDLIAITARQYDGYMDVDGDVLNVTIEDVTSVLGKGVAVLGGVGVTTRNISIDGVHGQVQAGALPVRIPDDQPQETAGLIDDLIIRDVDCISSSTTPQQIFVSATNIKNLTIEGQYFNQTDNALPINLSGCSIECLRLRGMTVQSTVANSAIIALASGATISRLIVESARAVLGTGNNFLNIADASSSITKCIINGLILDGNGAGAIFGASVAGATAPSVHLANVRADHLAWLVDTNITTVLYLSNVELTTMGGLANVRASGNLRLLGGAFKTNSRSISITAGGVVSASLPLFVLGLDISQLTPAAGDIVYNSSTSTSPGLGWVTYTGQWVSLASRNTGRTALVSGTKAITDSSITATAIVRVSNVGPAGSLGILGVVMNAGTGFTINSYQPGGTTVQTGDTSTVAYEVAQYK